MTGPLGLAALWIAAAACLTLALRARRPAAVPVRRRDEVPVLLRALVRTPAPAALRALVRVKEGEERIAQAGLGGRLTVAGLERARAGGAVAGAILALPLAMVATPAVALAPALMWAGAAAPARWVKRRAGVRRAAIVRELPDLLDLLELSVQAGMALDLALDLAARRLGGVLGGEVAELLGELAYGTPRRAAYRGLVARTGSPELAQVVGALLQAEELGAPLAATLGGQAEALRGRRRQLAREQAAKAAPKIQLVVALVMVPAVLILVLGILVIELTRQVGVVIGGA
jgi:tight adherence protein C